MDRSIRGVAYAMQVQADRLDVAASNIANINTRGFKREVVNVISFESVMKEALMYNTDMPGQALGSVGWGNSIDQTVTVFEQGQMERTGFKTDFALRGSGFFVVNTPDGLQYTRAGNFTFNQDGYLVTQEGYYVMGQKGAIQIPNKKISVDTNGAVRTEDYDNDFIDVDQFLIVDFPDLGALVKGSNGNYINSNNIVPVPTAKVDVLQNFIETSNVNSVEETRNMMDAKRNFESCQQVIKMMDDIIGKAASEIGRL